MLPRLETGRILGVPIRALVLAALAGVLAWNLWLRWNMLHQHRVELGGVELNVIHGIQKVMLGQALYEDTEKPPFDVIQYTPVYYLVCAGIGKAIGLAGDDARANFLVSRWVSLFAWLLTGLLVYRACRAAGAASWSSAMAAGVTLCCAWEQSFSRMDSLVLATSAATVLYVIKWSVTGDLRMLRIAAVVAVIGLFTKQSGAVMVAVPVIHLVLARKWVPLRAVLLTMGITTAIGIAITLSLGTPLAVYQNTVLGLRNGFSSMLYRVLFDPATYKYFIGWHILLIVIVYQAFRSDNAPLRFLGIAVVSSLAFALITGSKYGSALNYLQESLMLTFIGTVVLMVHVAQRAWHSWLAWSFAAYGGLFAAYRTNAMLSHYREGEPDARNVQLLHDDEAVRDVLKNDLGLKPDEKIFITYRGYLELFFTGQSMLTQKDIVIYSRDRLFDYTAFRRAMTDGTVRFVIMDGPPRQVTYLDSTYTGWQPVRTVHGRTILARDTRQ